MFIVSIFTTLVALSRSILAAECGQAKVTDITDQNTFDQYVENSYWQLRQAVCGDNSICTASAAGSGSTCQIPVPVNDQKALKIVVTLPSGKKTPE